MKAQYDNQPVKLEAVGNGAHLWRWNIQQIQIEGSDKAPRPAWVCDETIIWNEPTVDKIKQAVIRETWDQTKEAKLINDFNAAKEGLMPAESIAAYHDFLSARAAVKQDIETYFANL